MTDVYCGFLKAWESVRTIPSYRLSSLAFNNPHTSFEAE
jgi:hypothetical protein